MRRTIQRAAHRPAAFTLVEIMIVVIILAILAAFVVPQFSNATLLTRENTLRDDLRFMRMQIGVYKAQHEDVAPGYASGDPSSTPDETAFLEQLTGFTDEQGTYSATSGSAYPYGPYLTRMPPNPISGKTTIVIQTGTTPPTADDGIDAGWIFNITLEQIIANSTGKDVNGVNYADY